ncbi:MAG: hypothetical protein E7214_10055 [Clostridium sp.]|nr:hypothetical protein [Clostridium sp.]
MSRQKLLIKYFIGNALQGILGNKKRSPLAMCLNIFMLMVCISLPFTILIRKTYDSLAQVGLESTLIELFLATGSAAVLLFGMYSLLNTFYFANDVEPIMYMPFKSSEIILGKFLSALVEMYLYTGIIVVPLIFYGVKSNAGILFYIYTIISVLVLPIIPMIIGSLISMVLMRFTSLSKHKDAFRVVAGVFVLVLVVLFNLISQNASSAGGESLSFNMLTDNKGIIDIVSNIIFTNSILIKALTFSSEFNGLLYVLMALVISVCLFVLYYMIGGKLYYSSIVGSSETFSKSEDVFKSKNINKTVKSNSEFKALFNKEIRVLFRTPQFFMNGIAMLFYMPAILGIVCFSNGNAERIRNIVQEGTNYYGYILVGVFLFSTMAISSGGAAITAVSREGKEFFVSKYIPIDPKKQILAKITSSISVNLIESIIASGIIVFLKVPVDLLILSIVISIVSVISMSLIELFMDYKDPRLDWQSERDIYKKNFLPLIMPFATCILAGILAYLNYLIGSYLFFFVMMAGILVMISFIFYNFIIKVASKLYNQD